MTSDRLFRIPSLRLADAHAHAGGSTRVYLFAWRSPALGGRLGASHGMECPFVFDNFGSPMMTMMIGDAPPATLAPEMHGAWVGLATKGDPASSGAVSEWPRYDTRERMTMVFDERSECVSDPHSERRAAWDAVDVSL
jgi:para-nitrobenzyl esterase